MNCDNFDLSKECCEQLIKKSELVLFTPRTLEEALMCRSYWFFQDTPNALYLIQKGLINLNLQKSFNISSVEHAGLIDKDRHYFAQLLTQAFDT